MDSAHCCFDRRAILEAKDLREVKTDDGGFTSPTFPAGPQYGPMGRKDWQ